MPRSDLTIPGSRFPTDADRPQLIDTIDRYRHHARGYDASAQRTMGLRIRTIGKLDLQAGDRVLDVACGTGLSFGLLRDAVGTEGDVIGVEVSPDMASLARERVVGAGWENVRVIESAMETVELAGPFDAVLFNFTHDVLRSSTALARIFSRVRPGARIAFCGLKVGPWWMAPLNAITRAKARPYVSTLDGLTRPWELALPYLSEFDSAPVMFGIGYIGWGLSRQPALEEAQPPHLGHA